jgi:type III restriction enzyme
VELKFDRNQEHQLAAIESVVRLFDGQPQNAGLLITPLRGQQLATDPHQLTAWDTDMDLEVGAIGNSLALDREAILQNLRSVQDTNGLEAGDALAGDGLHFDVEMETGTGKTYVYLRTIFELAQKYSFTKFVILVPSVPIKEGVTTSVQMMREHFRGLYPDFPFDFTVYDGSRAGEVWSFATGTNVQIMVMTIGSIRTAARGDSRLNIHKVMDKLNGLGRSITCARRIRS